MKIHISKFNVKQEIKTSGIQLDVYSASGDARLGDLTITKSKLIWCAGKIHKKNGIAVTWDDFIAWMESE